MFLIMLSVYTFSLLDTGKKPPLTPRKVFVSSELFIETVHAVNKFISFINLKGFLRAPGNTLDLPLMGQINFHPDKYPW